MAESDALGKVPAALKNRVRDVTLSDGTVVRLVKWSLLKFIDLVDLIGNPKEWERLARESVRPEDRESLKDLPAEDILEIVTAARDMNLTETALKNVGSLLGTARAYGEAMKSPTP
jgi:hypothetical protein